MTDGERTKESEMIREEKRGERATGQRAVQGEWEILLVDDSDRDGLIEATCRERERKEREREKLIAQHATPFAVQQLQIRRD